MAVHTDVLPAQDTLSAAPDGDWHVRRFRPNLVDIAGDGWVEDTWCGRSAVRIGAVEVQPQEPSVRCTMVTRPQRGVDGDRDIFGTLARKHDGRFGAWTAVTTAGTVRVGDGVVEPHSSATSRATS